MVSVFVGGLMRWIENFFQKTCGGLLQRTYQFITDRQKADGRLLMIAPP